MKNKKIQAGIGLVEVLIAAVIFAVGSLALMQLQSHFFQNSSSANARSLAMSIAQQKLEDLRAFQTTQSADADIFDFTSITSSSGGQCTELTDDDTCIVELAATTVPLGNITFSRDWAVTDYFYNAGALSTVAPTGVTIPDQKHIVLSITWTDTDNTSQTLELNGVINKNSGVSSGSITNFAGGGGENPVIPYTPSMDDNVTPIGVGGDIKRETLVPSSDTVDGYSRTKFVAYTYNSNGNTLLRQEEFQNVACDCRFNGTSSDADKTYTAAHPVWDDDLVEGGTYIDTEGDLVSGKVKGCVQGGGSNCDANPEPFCDTCCRDHHDINSVARKYDPYRSTDDYTAGGNHKHYNGTTPVTSGEYTESCRFKRVNGFWRLYQDWNLIDYTVMPLTDLTTSTVKASYASYVATLTGQHIEEGKIKGETLTTSVNKPPATRHITPAASTVHVTPTNKEELTARAVYLDFMDSTHLSEVQAKKTAMQDYLLHVPFYEIEVAPISEWESENTSIVNVGPYDDGTGSTTYDLVGGQVQALLPPSASTAVSIAGQIKKSNSGLVALNGAVDYNANVSPDTDVLTDFLNVCPGTPGSCTQSSQACLVPWGGLISNGASVVAYQSASVDAPASCTSETRTCTSGVLSGSYVNSACSVIAQPTADDCTLPWGGWIANGTSIVAYSAETSADCSLIDETRTCTTGTLSGSFGFQSCTSTSCDTAVSGKANNKNDTIAISVDSGTAQVCTVANSKSYTCPPVSSDLTAVVTVTSSGTINATATTPTCGSQTVDFN